MVQSQCGHAFHREAACAIWTLRFHDADAGTTGPGRVERALRNGKSGTRCGISSSPPSRDTHFDAFSKPTKTSQASIRTPLDQTAIPSPPSRSSCRPSSSRPSSSRPRNHSLPNLPLHLPPRPHPRRLLHPPLPSKASTPTLLPPRLPVARPPRPFAPAPLPADGALAGAVPAALEEEAEVGRLRVEEAGEEVGWGGGELGEEVALGEGGAG